MNVENIFKKLNLLEKLEEYICSDDTSDFISSYSPITGEKLADIKTTSEEEAIKIISNTKDTFKQWRNIPAPMRGEIIRTYGNKLREHKQTLAELITLEVGKIHSEALGEVQEMIDICDYAVGVSRQIYGRTIASERPGHTLSESWHPVGVVGIISAFNFPCAVWCWNSSLALITGNTTVWKPSEIAPLCAIACQELLSQVVSNSEYDFTNISSIILGGQRCGELISKCKDIAVVSATGSVAMGRKVGATVAERFGKSILELGGNNAAIVTQSADLELAIRSIVFSAVGTCGQRCTTLRRLITHNSIIEQLCKKLVKIYESVSIGDPRDTSNLVGPLINKSAFEAMEKAVKKAVEQGGEVLTGGTRYTSEDLSSEAFYVKPALIRIPHTAPIVQEETFAPILYIHNYDRFEDAININNSVKQGLSSAVFTQSVNEAGLFCSALGSDCGIVNVNIGTSGAEIGGAFGGEKHTGGGRVAGTDSWKSYTRRVTTTTNYSDKLPLAQGVVFYK